MAKKPKPKLSLDATLVGPFQVRVTGLIKEISKSEWRNLLTAMAEYLQEKIATSFEMERVAGSSNLLANTEKYDAYKARAGFDERRGHKEGFLQETLHDAVLFQVGGVSNESATITMVEERLRSKVPYAAYYEEGNDFMTGKVQREGILVMAKSWVKEALELMKTDAEDLL